MKKEFFFPSMVTIYVVALITSNLMATKTFSVWNIQTSCGLFVFPITYLLSDIFSEVYGYKITRNTAWLAMFAQIFILLFTNLMIPLPYPVWWGAQEAYITIFGAVPRIAIASLVAFQTGDWINDVIFKYLKDRHGVGRLYGLRAVLSSIVGELFDSFIFYFIAFFGVMPVGSLVMGSLWQLPIKLVIECALLPLAYALVKRVRVIEGV